MAAPRVLMRPCGSDRIYIEKSGWIDDREGFKKAVAGAKFDWDRKVYISDDEQAARISRRLADMGIPVVMIQGVRERLQGQVSQLEKQLMVAAELLPKLEERLAAEGKFLFPFQRSDVLWMASRKRLINANQQGLGKSLEALCSLPRAEDAATLVVCPAVAKGVWRRETGKWRSDLSPSVLSGRNGFRWPLPGEVLSINFDILPNEPPPLPVESKGRLFVIGDEVHLLKNRKSKRYQRFEKIVALADRAIGLTGTPLPNKPDELWTILRLFDLAHEAFGSHTNFAKLFGGKKKHFGGYEWGTPEKESGERLKTVLVRHTKDEVLDQLPPKRYAVMDIELSAADERAVDRELADIPGGAERLLRTKNLSDIGFGEYSSLRELLARLKVSAIEEVAEVHEESGEPLIVFSAHRAPIEALGKRPGWATILGGLKAEERTAIEDKFQRGELVGIAATIAAASTAITLTRSAAIYFVDRSWTPADNEQAEDRAHRIGQERGLVVTDLVLDHVIDKHVHAVNAKKRTVVQESVEHAREFKSVDVEAIRNMLPSVPGSADLADRGSREPKSAEERDWIAALLSIFGLCDGAALPDDKGFSASDHRMCHGLCIAYLSGGALTTQQWYAVKHFARKYKKQFEKHRRAS